MMRPVIVRLQIGILSFALWTGTAAAKAHVAKPDLRDLLSQIVGQDKAEEAKRLFLASMRTNLFPYVKVAEHGYVSLSEILSFYLPYDPRSLVILNDLNELRMAPYALEDLQLVVILSTAKGLAELDAARREALLAVMKRKNLTLHLIQVDTTLPIDPDLAGLSFASGGQLVIGL